MRSRCWQWVTAVLVAVFAVPAAAQVATVRPTFGTLEIDPASREPQVAEIAGGGDEFVTVPGCEAWVAEAPDLRIVPTGGALSIAVDITATGEYVALVRTDARRWMCLRSDAAQAMRLIETADAERPIEIWIGSTTRGASRSATVSAVSAVASTPPPAPGAGALDACAAGLEPDPSADPVADDDWAALLNGAWSVDFPRSIAAAAMSDEERATAMAVLGEMDMRIVFAPDGRMRMCAYMLGETKFEEGTFRVVGVSGSVVTIETTTPGETATDPMLVEQAFIPFSSRDEAAIAPVGEDPLYLTRIPQ